MGLILDDWQKKFLEQKGDKILCSGRQVGKSVICSIDAAEWAVHNNKKNVLMIAPTERQAYALFEKTFAYLMEKYRSKIMLGRDRPTKEKLKLTNGTIIYCLPVRQSGLSIRFITVHRLYVEEASRIPSDVWTAIIPTLLTTGGDSIYLSTPFGKQGEFYKAWVNEDGVYNSFSRFSIDSEKVIRERPINKSWTELQRERGLIKLEQAKSRMSKREYAQEYLGEFVEDLFRFFGDKIISKTCILKRPEIINKQFNHFLGVDIARLGEDEGTFEIILKKSRDELIHVENIITVKKLTNETEDKIIFLDKQYNFRQIYLDAGAGSLGVSVLDHLLINDQVKRKAAALNNRAQVMSRDENTKQRLLKEDLYFNLLALMEQAKIKLLDDEEVIESLRSIQYEYVQKEGMKTRLRIFGNYSHVAEGLIRAAYCSKDKTLNIWCG